MRILAGLMTAAALLMCATPLGGEARAQTSVSNCSEFGPAPDYRAIVAHCTQLIEIAETIQRSAESRPDPSSGAPAPRMSQSETSGAALAIMYNRRGVAYRQLGDIGRAMADFNRSLMLSPGALPTYINRGSTFLALGSAAEAIADAEHVLAARANDPSALFLRGNALLALGEPARAIADYDLALSRNPTLVGILDNRAAAYFALGDQERAMADLDVAIQLSPLNANSHYNRANILLRMGQHDRAIEGYARAIQIDPQHSGAFNNRGNAYYARGEFERALADYNQALRLSPGLPRALGNRSRVCHRLGEAAAIEGCERGIMADSEEEDLEAEAAALATVLEEPFPETTSGSVANAARAARGNGPIEQRRFRDTLADGARCSFCPEMVVVPSGSFRMGSSRYEVARDADEGPRRAMRVFAFAAGRFEVTRGEWRACVLAGACEGEPEPSALALPAANVSWNDAQAYVRWLSRITGQRYRLLREAEWEYAARAGSRGPWSWGDDPALACRYANVWDLSSDPSARVPCDDGFPREVAPVGSLAPNAFGLHDMHGNLWEWVQDCYLPTYPPGRGRSLPNGDANHPSSAQRASAQAATTGGARCTDRVDRGGAFDGDLADVRSAQRSRHTPTLRARILGFRVARDLS